MEARIGGEAAAAHLYYGGGGGPTEWDPRDWKWDGDLFIATPLNCGSYQSRQLFPVEAGTSNSSSSCYDQGVEGYNSRDLDKKRRVNVVCEDGLALNLGGGGGQGYVVADAAGNGEGTTSGKKTKLAAATMNPRAVCCQVEDCAADLSKAM